MVIGGGSYGPTSPAHAARASAAQLTPSTIRGYLGAVQQFAEHFQRSPEGLGPEHLRHYQRYLLQEKKLAPSTVEMRISALRFLFKRTLKRRDLAFDDLIFPRCRISCRPFSARRRLYG
jgi:site-specific recombinase XerD